MKPKINFLFVLLFLVNATAFSQTDSAKKKEVKVTQLTVMVIPRTNDNEDVRTVLDKSEAQRIVIATIKEAFDKRGFRTIDFVARLNASKTDQAFMSANPHDAKSMIIQSSGTDIYVEADVIISPYAGGPNGANIARVNVQAYDASSAFIFGIKACEGPPNSANINSLVARAANDDCLQPFMQSLEAGWADIRKNGRPLKLHIAPSASSTANLFSTPKGATTNISTITTDWLEEHTVNSNYNVLGSTKLLMDVDDVRVPVEKQNKNYKPFNFGNDFVAFLASKGVTADSEIRNGTVYITINSLK